MVSRAGDRTREPLRSLAAAAGLLHLLPLAGVRGGADPGWGRWKGRPAPGLAGLRVPALEAAGPP